MIVVCNICSAEFRVKKSRSAVKYCSRVCQFEGQKNAVERTCLQCGKAFLAWPSKIKRGGGMFCSNACSARKRTKRKSSIEENKLECTKCNRMLPAGEFGTNGNKNHRPHSHCNECKRSIRTVRARTSDGRFAFGQTTAKRRGHTWTLERAEYYGLICNPCRYCGGLLEVSGCGLDRKDNDRGYEPDNVVPCCRLCNRIKSNEWTYDEMLRIGQLLRELKSLRKQKND